MRVFDAHCDTLDLLTDKNSLYDCETHYNLKKAGLYDTHIQVAAIWIDSDIHDISKRTDSLIKRFEKETENVGVIKSANDLKSALGTNMILGIEGGEAIGKSVKNLQTLFDRGVRIITLVWNHDNEIAGCAMSGEKGLTAFGGEIIAQMEKLGIMVDVSHLSERGFYDVVGAACKPFAASHSNSKKICNHFRNLTDDQFRCIIDTGGVAGINLYPEFLGENADTDTVIRHIEHFMSLGGENNVGIGADFDGIDCLPKGICGTQDLEKIAEKLLKLKYTEDLVEKIMYKNMERIFAEVLPD